MAGEKPGPDERPIQIVTGDELSRGRYSNSMMVTHSPEEFLIEWLLNSPSGTHLVSRIVVSPGHMRRIVGALSDNLRKYEERFGAVKAVPPDEQGLH